MELLAGYVRDFPVSDWVLCHGWTCHRF
jgi:hypothetical protein